MQLKTVDGSTTKRLFINELEKVCFEIFGDTNYNVVYDLYTRLKFQNIPKVKAITNKCKNIQELVRKYGKQTVIDSVMYFNEQLSLGLLDKDRLTGRYFSNHVIYRHNNFTQEQESQNSNKMYQQPLFVSCDSTNTVKPVATKLLLEIDGNKIHEWKCPDCDIKIKTTHKTCPSCNKEIDWSKKIIPEGV